MKKILSIALALVMVLALTVSVAAEEVLFTYDFMFFNCGNWEDNQDIVRDDFIPLLATPGAQLVITRDTATDITPETVGEGVYEKFCLTDTWYAGRIPNDEGEEINAIRLGTGTLTVATGIEAGKPNDVTLDCISDDGVSVVYDANAIYDLWTNNGFNNGGPNVVVISNTSSTAYKVASISIIVPDETAVEETPVEDTPVEDTPVEDTPAVETPVEEEPADTGLALAVVPMIVAAAAIVVSKRR